MNFDKKKLTKKLVENAANILRQAKSEIMNNPKYKILKSNHIDSFWLKRPNKNNFFTIYLEISCLDDLDFNSIELNLDNSVSKAIHTSNYIKVNEKFEVMHTERKQFTDSVIARTHLKDLSDNNYIVFFFGIDGVDVLANGTSLEEVNIFYNSEDIQRFFERKDISEIEDIFGIYQNQYLRKQHEYSRFFVDKNTIQNLEQGNNILKNKPEKFMRDHLTDYLNQRVQATFRIENELAASKRELDIYTEVNGEFYIFEIKWLGKSINVQGNKISTTYNDRRAREGVEQTLQYIEELINVMSWNLKVGYLVIFDAREKKAEIDYQGYNFIDENLRQYLSAFDVIELSQLNNVHPS